MKPIAKNKLTDPWGMREKGEKLPQAMPPSNKWRKKYDCKRLKGPHKWVASGTYYGRDDKKNSRLIAGGWWVSLVVTGKIWHEVYRWLFGSRSFHPDQIKEAELYALSCNPCQNVIWRRHRDIHCEACGKIDYETEFAQNGVYWEPDKSTVSQRKKFGTVTETTT